jgi:putative addiction module component (TIGR02574 family)
MSIDQIVPEALKLNPKERAMLASSLWESIEDPYELAAELTDQEALELAIERDNEMDTGQTTPLTHEQLMSQLRK